MVWIGAILAIGALIIVHESGHYIVARWCKMRVDKFSVGFGPAIWGWKRGDTQFQIAPIPFGGYVAIHGMLIAEDVDPDEVNSFPNRPAWQRFLTIFAGPATNYVFAIFLAVILYIFAGVPTGLEWYEVRVTQDDYDAHGKLLPGDRIEMINGKKIFYQHPDFKPPSLASVVQDAKDDDIMVTVTRAGELLEPIPIRAKADPKLDKLKDGTPRYRLGIEFGRIAQRRHAGILTSIGHAFWYPVDQTQIIVVGLYKVVRGREKGALTGPVGITSIIGGAIKAGWVSAFELLMILNVYLGLFNLFPLPALDGGRLVFLSYEMATRRRPNPKVEATVHMVGIMALLVIMVLVTYKDIARLL